MTLRKAVKFIAYESGALELFHKSRHRGFLTVLMFHRVLSLDRSRQAGADLRYTVTPEALAGIVEFLKQNYAIVGVEEVRASLKREKALPPYPVLITFDDGWRDNLEWGLPVLRDVPWALFIAADAISGDQFWWQEVLLWALRSGKADYAKLWNAVSPDGSAEGARGRGDELALLLRYGKLAPESRRRRLAAYELELRTVCDGRHMLTRDEVVLLCERGVAIGSHGSSHLPLSQIDDPAADLRRSLEWLRPLGGLPVMSFPHGRYHEATIGAARALGCEVLFTSDARLNPCPGGWLENDVIGRIPLSSHNVSGTQPGSLARRRLAEKLYLSRTGDPAEQFL